MLSWKLSTEFDQQRHLFFEKIITNYIVETYICSCGNINFIIKSATQKLDYRCKECDNKRFYDANAAWKNIGHFLYQNSSEPMPYEYEIQSDDTTINSLYILKIPKSIDYAGRKVIYSKKPVYTFSLGINGEIQENYFFRFKETIRRELEDNIVKYINKHNSFHLPKSKDKKLTLEMAYFFLRNGNLKDFDFYYWRYIPMFNQDKVGIKDALHFIANHTKAKSVKKAVYENYIQQLDDNDRFYPTFIEAFSKNIKDVNILAKLLKLQFDYSVYAQINPTTLGGLIVFLKKYYLEKQLLNFFSSEEFSSEYYFVNDMIHELLFEKEIIEDRFKKVSCKVRAIHDELVRCTQEERYKTIKDQRLSYIEEDMKPCIEVDNYHVQIPINGQELFDWADKLHNCMAGYFESIAKHKTIIYCFFQADIIKFAVEVSDGKIVQARGKYNAVLTDNENRVLTKWTKLFFQKKEQRLEHVA
jgi:DNA-directed RNA polymerase subunit RPC12/RpoP